MNMSPDSATEADQQPPTAGPAPKSTTKVSRQRFKPQLSCTLCRSRKLKCDRGNPCENCVKRDLGPSCTFIHAGIIRDKATHIQKSVNASNPKDVHNRIKHLEELVVSLMHSSNSEIPALRNLSNATSEEQKLDNKQGPLAATQAWVESTDVKATSESLGRITIEDEQSRYHGGSHWTAILDSISGLKESIDYNEWPSDTPSKTPLKNPAPALLTGSVRPATRAEILATMPPRAVVDVLIMKIFESGDISPTGIHSGSFMRQYHKFWADPDDTPIMWIGLLYAVMCLATNLRLVAGNSSPSVFSQMALRDPEQAIELFSEKVVQCLMLGNYTEPTTYTIETMMSYMITEYFRSSDAQVGGWMLMGLIVRAAMRLGYHREPSHYPSISVYRGEMQRRLWLVITHLDLHMSCAVGLPRMLREDMFDTKQPRNLLDSDFNEESTVLPPSRPDDEMTPYGFVRVKHGLTMVFARIMDQANNTRFISYGEVMALDKELSEVYAEVPEILKVHSVEDLKTGPARVTVGKFSVDLMYQKSRCILHRKFLTPPKNETKLPYPYSVKSCVDSAMAMLQRQSYIQSATEPGQRLYEHKWKLTTLMTQDFLLAAMLICLYLSHNMTEIGFNQTVGFGNEPDSFSITWTKDEMIQALESTMKICESASSNSKETLRAAKALKAMLLKVKSTTSIPVPSRPAATVLTKERSSYPTTQSSLTSQTSPELSTRTTSSSPWRSDSSTSLQYINTAESSYQVVDELMAAPFELNWDIWDTHFLPNSNPGGTPPELWNYSSVTNPFVVPDGTGMNWEGPGA